MLLGNAWQAEGVTNVKEITLLLRTLLSEEQICGLQISQAHLYIKTDVRVRSKTIIFRDHMETCVFLPKFSAILSDNLSAEFLWLTRNWNGKLNQLSRPGSHWVSYQSVQYYPTFGSPSELWVLWLIRV